jgi:hypothetical protein
MAHFVRDLLAEAIVKGLAGTPVLEGSAAVRVRTDLDITPGRMGLATQIQVPYFEHIGEAQDLPLVGGALSPATPSSAAEVAALKRAGKAFSVEQFERASASLDPYQVAEAQARGLFARKADREIISQASTAIGSNVTDVWSSGTPVYYGVDADVEAQSKWGDENTGVVLRVVHSRIWYDLMKLKDSTGAPLAQQITDGDRVIRTFLGVPTVMSDLLPVDSTNASFPKYTSLLFRSNACVFWATPPTFETDRDILSAQDIAATMFFYACHVYKVMPGMSKPGVQIVKTNGGRPNS